MVKKGRLLDTRSDVMDGAVEMVGNREARSYLIIARASRNRASAAFRS